MRPAAVRARRPAGRDGRHAGGAAPQARPRGGGDPGDALHGRTGGASRVPRGSARPPYRLDRTGDAARASVRLRAR